MSASLPPELAKAQVPVPVREVLARLLDGGFEVFLVGGCVRDLLLGTKPKDFDVATRALPGEVQKLFRKVIPTGIEHGTVTVLSRGEPVEVTTYRYESEYLDGRRPSKVEFHHDIEEDLARRDFTINAMAFNPLTGALKDPFGGQRDLLARRVRCVGVPAERFAEDGLRPLRAVRIATVLGFELDDATEQAIPTAVPVFRKVAAERVHDELVKLLLAPGVARGLALLRSTRLLAEFLPELSTEGVDPAFLAVGRAPPDEVTRLTVLLVRVARVREVLERLKFPTRVVERVDLLCREPIPAPWAGCSDGELRRWMARVGSGNVPAAVDVAVALGAEEPEALKARVLGLWAEKPPLTPRELALDGRAVMEALGVGQSPEVGVAIRFLMERVLDDPGQNTAEALLRTLRSWASSRPPPRAP